jgi:hypothetical protein
LFLVVVHKSLAKNENVRIQTQVLEADEDAFLALKTIAGYQPANPAYAVNAQNALAAARDAAVAVGWDFHNAMLGVKTQVASLGLKKKSERKAPARSSKVTA